MGSFRKGFYIGGRGVEYVRGIEKLPNFPHCPGVNFFSLHTGISNCPRGRGQSIFVLKRLNL